MILRPAKYSYRLLASDPPSSKDVDTGRGERMKKGQALTLSSGMGEKGFKSRRAVKRAGVSWL